MVNSKWPKLKFKLQDLDEELIGTAWSCGDELCGLAEQRESTGAIIYIN